MKRRIRMAASMAACWLAMTVVGAAEPVRQKADAKAATAESNAREKAGDKAAASKAADNKAANSKADDKNKEQKCVMTTGSRIRRDPAQVCAPGEQVYTAEELAATGEMNTSEALRKLDPRFQ